MIVMDTSGSMAPPELQQARIGATGFLQRLPADVAAGLTTTASTTRPLVAPTTDRQPVTAALDKLRSGGATALYDAVSDALDRLRALGKGEHRLVVLSDGADTSSRTTLSAITSELARDRVPVDVVAFKTTATSQPTLRQLAQASGGKLLASPNAQQMIASFAGAASAFSQAMWVTVTLPSDLNGRRVVLRAQARAGAVTVQAQTTVTVPATAAAAQNDVPALSAAPAAGGTVRSSSSPLALYVALGLCFVAIVTFVISFAGPGARPRTLADEIAQYGSASAQGRTGEGSRSPLRVLLGLSQRIVSSGSYEERLARDLERAALPLRPHEWALARIIAGVLAITVLAALTGSPLVGLLFGGLLALVIPRFVLSARVSRRLNAFADQLPDALQLIASSLRSGFTVAQSMDRLAQLDVQPLGSEIARAVAQTRLGIGVEDALDSVAERMECRDLAWVVMAIRIQREVGGNLADVIETTVGTMRERTHLRRHIRALSAEGRLSAYVLIALPFIVMGAIAILRASYLQPLFHDPIGLIMLAVSALYLIGGWVWMSRIIKVEA